MPTTLSIRFPAGRYHATPFGRHVNEGAVEWPPAPWRILRALLAAGFAKHGWPGDAANLPQEARNLVESLASVLPSYRLPKGGVAHTRHYMPIRAGSAEKTTKVLDTFLRFADDEPLLVQWPLDLDADQRVLLGSLAKSLAYLGRAESWVEASLLDESPAPGTKWASPCAPGLPASLKKEQVPLLASVPASEYAAWRERSLAEALAEATTPRERARSEALYPADLVACLCTDSATWQKQGWSQPPGSRQALYERPADALEPAVARPRQTSSRPAPVEAALLALAPDTRGDTVRPLMIRALPQMELLHQTLVGLAGQRNGGEAPPCLTGLDPVTGAPLSGHCHARFTPLDLDGDHRIDHVLVHAPMGLDHSAQDALQRIAATWAKNLPDSVVTLAGLGPLDLFREQLRDRLGRAVPEMAEATVWESASPFVAPRFLHQRGRNSLEGQVAAECESHRLPTPVKVEVLPREEVVGRGFLRCHRARREGRPQPPLTVPWCLRLTFATPLSGPIALGYGAHYGLGLFAAVPSPPGTRPTPTD